MIALPANYNDEVKPLPDGQHPFDVAGVTCKLSREVQAFLFHYGLGCEAADIMVTEDLVEMRDIALADPDGNAEQKDYYSGSVHLMMPRRKHQELIRMAFRRMLSPNPYAAVVPPPRHSFRRPRACVWQLRVFIRRRRCFFRERSPEQLRSIFCGRVFLVVVRREREIVSFFEPQRQDVD